MMTNEHTEIVIAVFEGENRANEVLADIDETTTSEVETLRDQVTVISLDDKGKLSASAPKRQKRQSSLGGALVGVLVGAAVGVPVVGALLGGVVGAWRVAKRKKSAQDFSLDQVIELMTPDSSLVVAEVEDWRVGVAIARALIHKPAVVLADEPTASLDSKRAHQVVQTFANLIHEQERAGVMVTHDLRMCRYVDKVIQMMDGRVKRVMTKNS